MCYAWIVFVLVLSLIFLLENYIRYLLPRQNIKVNRPIVGGQQWSEWVTDMVIGLLNHQTPPESIMDNILTVCRLLSPNNNTVESLPGVDFVHKCRRVLAVETKSLGGYRITKVIKVLEHHHHNTSRQGVFFGNIILKISTDARYEKVALSLSIFAANGTAESGVAAIQRTF